MFKTLFNLLFRRKPKHPAIVRKMPDGGFIVAHTEEEADRYQAAYVPRAPSQTQRFIAAELEALRLNRLEQALRAEQGNHFVVNRPPEFVKVRVNVIDEIQHFDPKKITTFNHPAIADDSSQRGRGNNED